MSKVVIEIPRQFEKEVPKDKSRLTEIFLRGLKKERAHGGLEKLRSLKGALKKAYPAATSVDLQHKAKELW